MTARRIITALAFTLAACNSQPSAEDVSPQPTAGQPRAAQAPTPATAPASAPAPARAAVVAIEGEGLRLFNPDTGAARPLPFGTRRDTVLAALAARGAPRTNRLEECGAGPLDTASWLDGLTLYFQDAKLVGWALGGSEGDKAAPTTAAGIAPGSTRAELDAAYVTRVEETTLGTEFDAGGLFGILEGKGKAARITSMWGGTSCNFR